MYIDVDTIPNYRGYTDFVAFHIDNLGKTEKKAILYGTTYTGERIKLLENEEDEICIDLYEAIVAHDSDIAIVPLSKLINRVGNTKESTSGADATIPSFLQRG